MHTLLTHVHINRILIASIRNLGNCPCPRCLIPLNRVHNLGMARDRTQRVTLARVDNSQRRNKISTARTLIYEKNLQVNCTAVEDLLKEMSLVPTTVRAIYIISNVAISLMEPQNAFSDRLSPFGFNVFSTLLPDVMHEFDSGGWRTLLIHLLRILQSVDDSLLIELDRRLGLLHCWLLNISCVEITVIEKYHHLEGTRSVVSPQIALS